MFKILLLIVSFYFAVCCGMGVEMSVICGLVPTDIYSCMGTPRVIEPSVSAKCSTSVGQCDRMTCLFRESGWMDGNKVDNKKYVEHFNDFKKQFPEWTAAVDSLKASCMNSALLPQGVFLNCPAYDVMLCSLTSFIKNAPPAKWSQDKECEYSRQYAASCPVCPNDCFAVLVPTGSCNACLPLRSP